ncbi:MAG: FAD-binding oxidoreductase [Sphingobacteriaceae bacterium]|nr:FAD-binding oxidoreductase [Sphingobacteriaceae bacterium]
MTNVDFIVVGQGLAGSVLSLKLIDAGYTVMVIDKPELSSCSRIAAGIWNPIVFKRLTKSWMIDELLPELLSFYKNAETQFHIPLITERHIVKLFSEQQEADLWKKKATSEVENYLDKTVYHDNDFAGIKISAFGYSKVLKSGNLDVKTFLKATQLFLIERQSMLSEEFNHQDLNITETISYKNITAKKIVFTEGFLIKNNPYFNYVPFKPAKGEVLTIETKNVKIGTNIINKNAFLMQLESNTYKLGATYNWEDLNENQSQSAVQELQDKFKKIAQVDYTILKHESGVRPSVIDRRPVMGQHPKHKNVFLFNGLGTKGVMLAPYFAQRLVNYFKSNESLLEEVNVSRFNKFFVN